MQIIAQLLPVVHIVLACIATAVVLKRRSEVSSPLVIVAYLVAWLIPVFGPVSVLLGFCRPRAA